MSKLILNHLKYFISNFLLHIFSIGLRLWWHKMLRTLSPKKSPNPSLTPIHTIESSRILLCSQLQTKSAHWVIKEEEKTYHSSPVDSSEAKKRVLPLSCVIIFDSGWQQSNKQSPVQDVAKHGGSRRKVGTASSEVIVYSFLFIASWICS